VAIDLKKLKKSNSLKPPRIVLYGPHGLGKSTFGASAPDPIFTCTEDGLGAITTTSFPLASTWAHVIEQIDSLLTQQHKYRTYVVDTLDWLEPLIWEETCKRGGKANIEEFGYGKGYLEAATVWREFLTGLNALRDDKGMMVILLAHTEIKRFDSPETEPYDRYQIKLHKRAAELVQEWADCVLFCNYRTIVQKTDVGFNKKATRGVTTGERLIYTAERPAALGKNRYSLPAELPLAWDAFSDALSSAFTNAT
jgi:hypothetical protein